MGLLKERSPMSLQTRPIDYRCRMVKIRGSIEPEILIEIYRALKVVFALD
jgi:mRNA interferase MazF